jgi:hypothetical protein
VDLHRFSIFDELISAVEAAFRDYADLLRPAGHLALFAGRQYTANR